MTDTIMKIMSGLTALTLCTSMTLPVSALNAYANTPDTAITDIDDEGNEITPDDLNDTAGNDNNDELNNNEQPDGDELAGDYDNEISPLSDEDGTGENTEGAGDNGSVGEGNDNNDGDYYSLSGWFIDANGHCDIPDGTTVIPDYEFLYKNQDLKSVNIPASVERIGESAFCGCINLTTVNFSPASQLTSIGGNAFYNCSMISLSIPDTVITIGDSAFSSCTKLNNLKLPANLREVGEWSFMNCENLGTLTLPSQLETIGSNAFSNCLIEGELVIPASVKTIGNQAFGGIRRSNGDYLGDLNKLIFESMPEEIGWGAFENISLAGIQYYDQVEGMTKDQLDALARGYGNTNNGLMNTLTIDVDMAAISQLSERPTIWTVYCDKPDCSGIELEIEAGNDPADKIDSTLINTHLNNDHNAKTFYIFDSIESTDDQTKTIQVSTQVRTHGADVSCRIKGEGELHEHYDENGNMTLQPSDLIYDYSHYDIPISVLREGTEKYGDWKTSDVIDGVEINKYFKDIPGYKLTQVCIYTPDWTGHEGIDKYRSYSVYGYYEPIPADDPVIDEPIKEEPVIEEIVEPNETPKAPLPEDKEEPKTEDKEEVIEEEEIVEVIEEDIEDGIISQTGDSTPLGTILLTILLAGCMAVFSRRLGR